MELILVRHGNTFNQGDRVVWIGSHNDLPLVPSGQEQAKEIGRTLLAIKKIPTAIYTGPLQRMKLSAQIIIEELKLKVKPIVDVRLNEIDYGQWSGLATEEVRARFGEIEFENWEKYSKWPQEGEWGESEALVTQRIQNFAHEIVQDCADQAVILVVASNGCLRYFLDLIPGEFEKRINNLTIKIATGGICRLVYDSRWQLDFWNASPQQVMDRC